jgi:catechol 2,3-dioxygenase-like lactoylglutathione lyase family enzyme
MMKFDHLNLPVGNLECSRDWWVSTLGLKVEFEVADTRTVALNDSEGFAIFLQEKPDAVANVALWFQVDDVDATHAAWSARGVASRTGRRKTSGATAPSSPTPTVISSACGTRAR